MRYSFEDLSKELQKYGFILIDFISTKSLISIDEIGYKYKINLCNLKMGKKPNRFMKNPFALDNFKLYLQINYPDYELLDNEYINCKTKMRFICHKHPDKGIHYNSVDNIINNHHACLYCSCSELWESKRMPIKRMIEECNRVGVKFVKRTSKNNECYVNYICKNHKNIGIQQTSWAHFKEIENGRPYCNKISKGENKICNYLSNNNIDFIKEYIFDDCIYKRHLKFDFYIPILDLIIEYNGQQHYSPVKIFGGEEKYKETIKRDKIKIDYCKNNKIKMIVIPYWDYDNIETILEPFVKEAHLLCEKV